MSSNLLSGDKICLHTKCYRSLFHIFYLLSILTSFCVQNDFRKEENVLVHGSVEQKFVCQQDISPFGYQKIEIASHRHEHFRLAVKKIAHDSEMSPSI